MSRLSRVLEYTASTDWQPSAVQIWPTISTCPSLRKDITPLSGTTLGGSTGNISLSSFFCTTQVNDFAVVFDFIKYNPKENPFYELTNLAARPWRSSFC